MCVVAILGLTVVFAFLVCVCVFVLLGFFITCSLFPDLSLIKLIQMEIQLLLACLCLIEQFQYHTWHIWQLLTFCPLTNSTIIRGEGTAMTQAKPRTRPSSQWSMLGWPRTTLTIWASKPSWRPRASRQPRPWSKAKQVLRGKRRRKKIIKKRQTGWKSRSRRKRRKNSILHWSFHASLWTKIFDLQ